MARYLKAAVIFAVAFACAAALAAAVINLHIIKSSEGSIGAKIPENTDCIIVLGAGVKPDGSPTPMLEDRLKTAVELYKSGAAPKIIMSGDHGQNNYDEVNAMKKYAVERGVPSEDIFMDHAGFSTYETMYRAKEIFKVDSAVIVTQKYHMYRALYIAKALGINAVGRNSDPRRYAGQTYRDLREAAARVKDFFAAIIKPGPTYLGDTVPVSGNGDVTNDKPVY